MSLPILPTKELNLTQVDRQGLIYRAQFLAQQVIPQWSDFSLSFPENVLLEGCATMVSTAISVMNERFRQHALATMTSRLAAIRKGRITGYTLQGATAATVGGTFVLPNSVLATTRIPLSAGLRLQSGDAIWQLLEDTAIEVGSNASPACTLENADEQEHVQLSSEEANLVIQLDHTNIIEGSITVTAGNGTYSNYNTLSGRKLFSFVEVGPDTLSFIAMLDNNGRAYIFFGNGINGAIPQGSITVAYKTGGGEDGRVEASATWSLLDGVYDASGQIKTVQFVNAEASVGGFAQTTIEEARIQIPQSVRTLERAVNEADFEYAATRVPGIARAALMTSNHVSSIDEDAAKLYLIAYGSPDANTGYYPPASPTATQIAAVRLLIDIDSGEYAQMMGLDVTVLATTFRDVAIQVKIFKDSGYSSSVVKSNITDALTKLFAVADENRARNALIDFGFKLKNASGTPDYKLAWSRVFNAINDAEGVREVSPAVDNLLLNGARLSIILQPNEFPRLSTITVYDMDSSGAEI